MTVLRGLSYVVRCLFFNVLIFKCLRPKEESRVAAPIGDDVLQNGVIFSSIVEIRLGWAHVRWASDLA